MSDGAQTQTHEDEIILSARYSPLRVWFWLIIIFPLPALPFFYIAYACMRDGNYIGGAFVILLCAGLLIFALDALFFERLLFYQDRVVKVWRLFGRRTLYYSRASITQNEESIARYIVESYEDGSSVRFRLPIMYIARLFPRETTKRIGIIVDYLTEDNRKGSRKFKKSTLPKFEQLTD
jgi:hypothetical protein